MWQEGYDKLNNSEKEEYKRLLNYILSHTHMIRDMFAPKEGIMRVNPDYRFMERHFDLFSEYLGIAGWVLSKDSNYGVISLSNAYDYNRVRLDRNTTLILYTLRLIFEEEREKVALRNEILTTTGQMVHKMMALGIVKKKPSDKDLAEALRLLANYNIIQKLEGPWWEPESKLLILPSILFIVTNEKISRLSEMLDGEEQEPGTDEDADYEEEVIRGEDAL